MPRRIFISYQHDDRMKAKGFNLLRWSKAVDVEFVGRHLLDPVDSENEAYVWRKITEQLRGTSVTVVLLGARTADSDWVRREIKESVEKETPNGVLAIKLSESVRVPVSSPVGSVLNEVGAETIEWEPHTFAEAIERVAIAGGRGAALRSGTGGTGGGCAR